MVNYNWCPVEQMDFEVDYWDELINIMDWVTEMLHLPYLFVGQHKQHCITIMELIKYH